MKIDEKELEKIKEDVKLGCMEARYKLALMYLNNEAVPELERDAYDYFCIAAAYDHAGAQYQLGMMFYEGNRISKNEEFAVKNFRKAAEQGHPEAIKMLEDLGVDLTIKITAKGQADWVRQLTEAAEQGDAESQFRLAMLYAEGAYGLSKDVMRAYDLFQKAAAQKYEPAYNYTHYTDWIYHYY